MAKIIYVVPDQGRWAVKQDDGRLIKYFNSQAEAEKYGIESAKASKSELLVHGLDGQVIRKSSYQK